jgi:transcriptional regulator GlxA family with amidase domain
LRRLHLAGNGRKQNAQRIVENPKNRIQALRAHIASEVEWSNKGWLRAIFDPQVGAALRTVHDSVSTPWTVESLAAAATMSRSAFAVRFKELLGQTPLE